MSSSSLQFVALLQLVVLLLAGGLGEALHALPGAAHDGHGCGHGCRHHGDHHHGHACHDHGTHACLAMVEEDVDQVAGADLAAEDGDCLICRLLRGWRQADVSRAILYSPFLAMEAIAAPPRPTMSPRIAVAPHSRGPPAIL
ncbi:hypothetical protein [Blastopirellula retiformator]|uniref:hypothetical protein n=1 Tax=Blastopirellula retiformator TaxID=2527970 RepID=UPI0011B54C9D|nr:hypothetical protein [Blastopirellula retiformator]